MGTSAKRNIEPLAVRVRGTPAERAEWQLIGNGIGIHWPALDEDISVEGLMDGLPSGESQRSFEAWLRRRQQV
ncbi:MAG: DUF2442 domain-containing protein [Gammaproteobacteria bacterium]|nr:DUF2442 domain-containing protein [Gammaproteobacteria bacterium]